MKFVFATVGNTSRIFAGKNPEGKTTYIEVRILNDLYSKHGDAVAFIQIEGEEQIVWTYPSKKEAVADLLSRGYRLVSDSYYQYDSLTPEEARLKERVYTRRYRRATGEEVFEHNLRRQVLRL